jgi:hypothetical protein
LARREKWIAQEIKASSVGNGKDARFVIRLCRSPACAQPLRRRQVLRSSRLRAETHFGVQARTMKIPLNPPFSKGDNYTSLWQREAGRDFKKLFSNNTKKGGLNSYVHPFSLLIFSSFFNPYSVPEN